VAQALGLHGQGPLVERFAAALTQAAVSFQRRESSDWTGLEVDGAQLRLSDGRSASQLGAEVAVFDLPLASAAGAALAWAPSLRASLAWVDAVPRWLQLLGFAPQRLGDAPGLVVARTIAMLINEAADAVQQGVCTAEGADAAMKLGVNYPAGPFEWLARWDSNAVVTLLDALDAHYRGERYRVSPWLRQRAWA
jgi:3-hydroxybutyryl-CoA dehydrogenase